MSSVSEICTKLSCGLLIVAIAFLGNILYKVGEFQILNTHNVRNCRRIEGYYGCEDFAYFENKNIYMSCDDRSWLRYQHFYSEKNLSERIMSQKNQGKLYLLKSLNYDKPILLKLNNYPHKDFHPLGIAILNDKNGKYIYVTDNQRNGEKINIFKLNNKNENELDFITSITFNNLPPFQMLNDLIVIPNNNGAFYVTIWLVNEPGKITNFFDVSLLKPVSYVLYCKPKINNFLQQNIVKFYILIFCILNKNILK